MIEAGDVMSCLMNYGDIDGAYTKEQLYPSCERGLQWVRERLRDDADENNVLITHTAAAMAHFFFFLSRLTEPDRYETYTAGDMTVRRNITKEMVYENQIKDQAIAAASSILKDGGFYCCGA